MSSMAIRRKTQRPTSRPPAIRSKASVVDTLKSPWTWYPSFRSALLLLLAVRTLSALLNIVHDCDEVFNYWEPIHYLLYGSGMQTWEYSSKFALRSYLYILLHSGPASLLRLVVGAGRGKILVFYGVKIGLGAVSAFCDALLYSATKPYGSRLSRYLLLLLLTAAGPNLASTTLLPSTFAMYGMTLATAGLLAGHTVVVIVAATLSVVLGWAVAGLAFAPFALYVLLSPRLPRHMGIFLMTLAASIAATACADAYFFGRPTLSLLNFLQYNVQGGGDSALYGVEPPTYYLRNGLNNFNLAFAAAALYPCSLAMQIFNKAGREGPLRRELFISTTPLYVWFIAITLLPHKEERFLYVVYPQIALAAAAVAAVLASLFGAMAHDMIPAAVLSRRRAAQLGRWLARTIVTVTVIVSGLRCSALYIHYGAPMAVWRALPPPTSPAPVVVCAGAEWHRFPSSFFLPGPNYRLAFVRAGFGGALPLPFDPGAGGTRGAPDGLNDRNQSIDEAYVTGLHECDFLVDFELPRREEHLVASSPELRWRVLADRPFVEASESPTLSRALWLPWLSRARNAWGSYRLYQRERALEGE